MAKWPGFFCGKFGTSRKLKIYDATFFSLRKRDVRNRVSIVLRWCCLSAILASFSSPVVILLRSGARGPTTQILISAGPTCVVPSFLAVAKKLAVTTHSRIRFARFFGVGTPVIDCAVLGICFVAGVSRGNSA